MTRRKNQSAADQAQRIAELVKTIETAEAELQALTGGQLDAVITLSSRPYLLREAQERLRMSEAATRTLAETQTGILNALPAQIAVLDAQGVIQAVNESWRRFPIANALQSHDFVIGQNYLAICDNVGGECAKEACQVASGIRPVLSHEVNEFFLEYSCTSAADSRWFRVMITPLSDKPGNGAVVMHVDVTDLRLAEQSLAVSRQQYQDVVESSHDLIWAFDSNGVIRFINQASKTIFGRSPEEMVGRNFQEFVPLGRLSRHVFTFAETMEQGTQEADYITQAYHKDGHIVSLSVNSRTVRDASGHLIGGTCNGRDVTETLHAHLILQESEARFRAFFDQAAVGMCLVSATGKFLRSNQKFCEVVGYSPEELQAQDCIVTTHPDDRAREAQLTKRILAGELKSSTWEKRYLHKAGHEVWCNLTLSLMPDEGRESRQFVAVIEDITNRRQAAEERDRAEAEAQRAAEALRGIVQIQQELATADLPVHPLMNLIAERSRVLTGGDSGVVEILDGDELVHAACSGAVADKVGLRVACHETLSGLTVTTGTVLHSRDTETDPRCNEDDCRKMGVRSLILAPIRVGAETIGTLKVTSGKPNAFSDRDVNNLQILTETLGVVMQKQRAADLLRNSEGEFRTLAEVMPQIVWVTRADGWTTYLNQHWVAYTGLSMEEGLGHNWMKPFHPDDRKRAFRAWHRAVSALEAYELECRVQRADGVYRWWLTRGQPLYEMDGRVLKWIGTCTDIHDLKVAELEIFRVNRALKMLSTFNEAMVRAENEPDLLAAFCRTCVSIGGFSLAWVGYAYQDMNRSVHCESRAGTDRGYLENNRFSWAENHSDGQGPVGQVIRSGRPVVCGDLEREDMPWSRRATQCDFRSLICLPLREGARCFGVITLHCNEVNSTAPDELKLLQELADDLVFGIGNLRARAAKRLADQKLAEQAKLLDKTTDAIFVRDLEHRVVFWNKGAEELFGWRAAEILGHVTTELLYPDRDAFLASVDALLDKGEWSGELHKQNRQGKSLIVHCRWTLVLDETSKPESVLCIETDITEKKKLEIQFLRAQRLESIGTLASGIAHDLNNVLAPIVMSAQLLKEDARDAETLKMLDTIESCSQRGAELIRQVLTFARGVEGQQVSVDLKALISELKTVMKEIFPKDIGIDLSARHDLWTVTGDPTQMHQVFLNLCVNARDAMPRGGKLTILLENIALADTNVAMNPESKPGAYVLASIIDSGVGIPPAILDRIFEPFFTTKEHGKGTGLGLSTVIGIVRNHGGFIDISSEVGEGSKFKVYLPANASPQEAKELSLFRKRVPRGRGELILVVDDEKSVRNVAAQILKRYGYTILEAANGAEAVSIYVQNQKDIALVITDVSMPIMDGAALVTALKAINPKVRVLLSSGLPAAGAAAKAVDAGDHGFIPKPYTAEKLLGSIAKEISKSE